MCDEQAREMPLDHLFWREDRVVLRDVFDPRTYDAGAERGAALADAISDREWRCPGCEARMVEHPQPSEYVLRCQYDCCGEPDCCRYTWHDVIEILEAEDDRE